MTWVFLVIYGIAFGILSSIAVKNKNRDQGIWFLVGFLFGIFGFIAAIIIDKYEPEKNKIGQPRDFDPSIITKKCPDCAEEIKLEAKVCRFCRREFTEEEVAEQIRSEKVKYSELFDHRHSSDSSEWQCPICYTNNDETNSKCKECGYTKVKESKSHRNFDITCPNCKNTELISETNLFDESKYISFIVKEGFFSGKFTLTCMKCNHKRIFNPYQLRDSK